jgi:hypothetical protein
MTAPTHLGADDDDLAVTPPPAKVASVGLFRRLQLTEPVRLYLYGVVGAVLAVLVGLGVLNDSDAALWSALGAAVLSVPLAEGIRSQVYSQRTWASDVLRAGGQS